MTTSANRLRLFAGCGISRVSGFFATLALLLCMGLPAARLFAQSGEGSLQGTVSDASGAVIPNASETITNKATNVATKTVSSSAGYYILSPVHPGTYMVEITAAGFEKLMQDNVVVNALQARVFNPQLAVGNETETVEVTAAPPVLDTADATLGLTVENDTYTNLPLQMNGSQQRDPTAFAALTPGAQSGTRMPVIGGTGNYLGQLYLEGMPATTVNMQGDNRVVSLSMSVEAVDQFQVLTSTPPAEYMGAGAMNFTMKSGGLKYHGKVADYVRNTVFDSWGFTNKWTQVTNTSGQKVYAAKPVEHQNELSMSFGGVVPKTHDKMFFFVAYDKYHNRKAANASLYTIPTQLMIAGDFTELNGNVGSGGQSGTGTSNPAIIYDPTSNSCTSSTSCSRTPFQATKNGVATYNVIPSAMISPIAKAMASYMPAPTFSNTITSNYLYAYPKGYDNHLTDWRVDYDLSTRQRISSVGAMGAVHYLNNFSNDMPMPYVAGTYANIFPKSYIIEHVFTINANMVNQLKYSYTRFIQPQTNATDGSAYTPGNMGISNVPTGQASTEFPGATFGTTSAYGSVQTAWTSNSTSATTQQVNPNTFTLTDNLQYLHGKHSLTFGFSRLWEEINSAAPKGYSAQLNLLYNAFSTANFSNSSLSTGTASAPSGYSFASYMLGAVAGSSSNATSAPSVNLYPLNETGGRYHTLALYFRDTFKVSSKLTIDYGMRWDYLPPYHEVKDRWTFLNPALMNPLTNTFGMLQFAGNWGGSSVSCQCKTPVSTYWKNLGPRVGVAYEINQKTILRTGAAVVYSQAGGVGGRAGAATGTGQTGFNMSATGPTEIGSGVTAGPSYWLNNSTGFAALSLSNTSLLGSGYSYPSAPTPGVSAQELNTGYYVSGSKMVNASSVSYADPYLSGRAPQIVLWNFGLERSITPDLTLGVNYVGNESHFIVNSGTTGSNARGYWTNQVNPKYLAVLGSVKDSTNSLPILNAAATAANAAIVQSYFPQAPAPAFFTAAGAISSSATIAQMLTAFPQYSGVSDTWGNTGNYSYHALQVTLNQRMHKGLTYNVNYTYAKNVGDDGTFRSGFDLPAAAISNGTRAYKQNRIDRGLTSLSMPHTIHAYGVYKLPLGKNGYGNSLPVISPIISGWQISGIYQFSSGTPIAATWSGASTTTLPGQGTAMPDMNPAYKGNGRTQYKYGSGPKGRTACSLGIGPIGDSTTNGCSANKVQYLDPNAFTTPTNLSNVSNHQQYLIGNAPRTRAYSAMRNPYYWNVDAGVRRTIDLHKYNAQFTFEADVTNVWNHATFGSPSASWGSSTYGMITGMASTYNPRDWQFAGHLSF